MIGRLLRPVASLVRLLLTVEWVLIVCGAWLQNGGSAEPVGPKFLTDHRPAGLGKGDKRRSRGPHVIAWIEANCVHTNDRWTGKPFRLLPWQKALLIRLFELDPATGLRRYRWAYISVAKKNGKTEMAAALALYFAFGSMEPSALVVCAAASDDQADLVFGAAKRMVELSPTLGHIAQPLEKEIVARDRSMMGCKVVRYAVGGGRLDGQNIYVAILDELHEWILQKHEDTWHYLTQGGVTRREPMILQISTSGADVDNTICGEQYTRAVKASKDPEFDPEFYGEVWEAEPDCDVLDPDAYPPANPSLGITVSLEYLLSQARRKPEARVRRHYLNQWTEAAEQWVNRADWKRCGAQEPPEFDPSLPLYVAIDFAKKRDSAAVTRAQRIPDGPWLEKWIEQLEADNVDVDRSKPFVMVRCRIWSNPYTKDDDRYHQWKLPHAAIENYLRELREEFPVPAGEVDDELLPGPVFGYDPWRFDRSAEVLEGEGLNMLEVPQSDPRMVPISEHFIEGVNQHWIVHDDDPVLAMHVYAISEKVAASGRGSRIDKRSARHNDGGVATAIAVSLASQLPPPPDEGFLWTESNAPTENELEPATAGT